MHPFFKLKEEFKSREEEERIDFSSFFDIIKWMKGEGMKQIIYQNYHKHDYYSNPIVPDSVAFPENYAKKAVELGHSVISSVNHGWQSYYIDHYELSKKYNLKFLFGVEAYWVIDRFSTDENGKKDKTNNHIVLLAKNEKGRRAINRILSDSAKNKESFYYRPRIDINQILSLPSEDVWVTTACIAYCGYGRNKTEEITKIFQDHFKNNFFLEIQAHNTEPIIKYNEWIKGLSEKYGIPMIAGTDSHYIDDESAWERDDYLKSKGIFYEDEEGWHMDYPDGNTFFQRFKNQNVFTDQEILDAINNTNTFLDVEEYNSDIFHKNIKMYNLYPDKTQKERNLMFLNLVKEKWLEEVKNIEREKIPHYLEELKKELKTIIDTNHADYFLFDYAMVRKGIENGGEVTPTGRGSAVSFYVNKLLGFTQVDRIDAPVPLFPERFMSITRILETKSLADIDINVNDREPFIQAHIDLAGTKHAVPMFAMGTMKQKAAWQMYARAAEIEFTIANEISGQIEEYEKYKKYNGDDKTIYDFISPEYHQIYDKSKKYLGVISDWKIAPSAILVYSGDIEEEIGLIKCKENVCCIVDKTWGENYKFLKSDILKVSVIDLIYKTFDRIGVPILSTNELIKECEGNEKVWDIYRDGITLGVNQVEQKGSRSKVMNYRPQNVSELSAFIAAIRPGFKSMYSIFEKREHFDYGIPIFDNLIQTKQITSSFVLYQENTMQVLGFSGIPMDETYGIVKAISKKNKDKIMGYKKRMMDGFAQKLVEEEHDDVQTSYEIAEKVWKILEDSSEYSFNACVTGDTVLYDGEGYLRETVAELSHKDFYGYALSLQEDHKRVRKNFIIDIRVSGAKRTYEVTVETGATITCTPDHKFPTALGELKLEQMRIGDSLYVVDLPYTNVKKSKITNIKPKGIQLVYDIEMAHPYHSYVVKGGIVTSNSHSYCMALDSLYCSYLKATYPLEFYEVFLNLLDMDGDKRRLDSVKKEAYDYHGITIKPMKFRNDNRRFTADYENNAINNTLSSLKGFGSVLGEELYNLRDAKYECFTEVLYDLSNKTQLTIPEIETLIVLNYFEEFGNNKKLLNVFKYFKLLLRKKKGEISEKIQIKINEIKDKYFLTEDIVSLFSEKKTEKIYKGINVKELLKYLENRMKNDSLPINIQLSKEKELLGHPVTTIERYKKTIYWVEKLSKSFNRYYITLYNICTGSIINTKITDINIFSLVPFEEGDCLDVDNFYEKQKVKKIDGKWVKTEEREKILNQYIVLK